VAAHFCASAKRTSFVAKSANSRCKELQPLDFYVRHPWLMRAADIALHKNRRFSGGVFSGEIGA
jgi:hypothetical protein